MSISSNLKKFTPRKEQQDVLNFIKETKKNKPDNKFFLLNIPPGVGKSHIALMISQYYLDEVSASAKFDIITDSKVLQDQYMNTYDCLNDLKGKENYTCDTYACSCLQGKEFAKLNKTKCDSCPYDASRDGFIFGKMSLTNFYLYILYRLYMPKMVDLRSSNVLIVDECHQLDDVMSNFISIKITEFLIKRLRFVNEQEVIDKLKKIKSIIEYIDFLKYLQGEITVTIDAVEISLAKEKRTRTSDARDNKISKIFGGKSAESKTMQILADLEQYKSKIEIFLKEYESNTDNWVLETHWNEKTKQNELSIEPIWAFDYLDKYIFSKYDAVFLMSGTILNKGLFCQLNGIDAQKAVYYSINSPFPARNRPIYYLPSGKMSYKNKVETFKNYVPVINKILEKYPDKKGIIHTNSFELASWVRRDIHDPRLIYHDSTNKDEVLQNHFSSDIPTVIVSPSMDIGLSFDDEKARFQVIAKIPYPSLASQKNKMRLKINPECYSYKTVCDLLQILGRPIRSMEDWADTIILDSSFSDVLRHSSHYIPEWIQTSIKKVKTNKV